MPVMWPAIKYEVLHNSKLQPGQDPDFYLYAMDGARDRLHERGEVITDQRLADKILKAPPDEYESCATAATTSTTSGWRTSSGR